jgi:hypothetical protein
MTYNTMNTRISGRVPKVQHSVQTGQWLRNSNIAFSSTQNSYLYQTTIFFIGIVGDGVQLSPLDTAATNGLLCQPRVIKMLEKLVER